MARPAHVTSIAALREFRADLLAFADEGKEALSANDMEVQRAFAWLDTQAQFWAREIRNRYEAIVQAKQALRTRKIMKIFGKPPDCTEQEKALRIAKQRHEEAEQKLAACKRWAPQLRRYADEYEAKARHLGNMLEVDVAKAAARLEKQVEALEAYVGMAPPVTPPGPKSHEPSSSE
jgi:hypothetical protein